MVSIVRMVNVCFLVTGVCLLIVGVLSVGDKNFQRTWRGLTDKALASRISNVQAVGITVVIMGAVMLLFGISGFLLVYYPHILKERACILLTLYILVVVFLMAAELTVASVSFVFRSKLPDELQKSLTEGVRDLITGWPDKHDDKAPFNQFFLSFQYDVGCCGSNNYSDYFGNSTYQMKPSPNAPKCNAVPLTCCERNNQLANNTDWSNLKPTDLMDYNSCCNMSNKAATGRYHAGCFNQASAIFVSYTLVIGLSLIVFALLQVAIVLVAVFVCLRQSCRNGANDYESI